METLEARLAPVRLPLIGLAVTMTMILVAVIAEQAGLSGPSRMEAWLGHSWRTCTVRVALISLVAAPFIFVAARRLAPHRPTLSGFAAGVVAGGVAASAYGFHCPEATTSFMASWYNLGILVAGGIGAVLGRRLLRW